MNQEVAIALIETAPQLVVALLVLGLVAVGIEHRESVWRWLNPRLASVKVGGIEVTLLKEAIQDIATSSGQSVSDEEATGALRRAQRSASILDRARVLWTDDNPAYNEEERRILRDFGVEFDLAQDTDEALKLLRRHHYDLVLTDMARRDEDEAGNELVRRMRGAGFGHHVIFYVGRKRDLPSGAFGLTTRPDELLHLCLDVFERARGG